LHELATNAAKYGALAVSSGKVTVSWNVSATEPLLTLLWKETGGPPVKRPSRKGFGSRLIEALSSGHLRGQVDLNYDVLGVNCMIGAPLDTEWSDHDHIH
jgi:two-component sensor histidine kinase